MSERRRPGVPCVVQGCGRPAEFVANPQGQGYLCASHTTRLYRNGDTYEQVPVRQAMGRTDTLEHRREHGYENPLRVCGIEGCERRHHGAGLCVTHYVRKLRTGSVSPEVPVKRRVDAPHVCSVEGCGRSVIHDLNETRDGYVCPTHHARRKNHGDYFAEVPIGVAFGVRTLEVLRERIRNGIEFDAPMAGTCSVEGCERETCGQGLCQQHWRRTLRYGYPVGEVPIG